MYKNIKMKAFINITLTIFFAACRGLSNLMTCKVLGDKVSPQTLVYGRKCKTSSKEIC